MRICTMCQGSATHYCAQDDAFLCSDCNITIHSANALASRHKVVAIAEAAQEQMVVADAHSEASATPCVVTEHPSVDVCLDASWTTSAGVVPVMDEDIPSLLLDGADFNRVPPLWDNNFDVFDMDNGWMGKLDDCLATDIPFPEAFNEAGLVPCLSPSFQDVFDDFATLDGFEVPDEPREPKRMKMSEENDWSDLVVPSLHMPNVYPSPAQYSAPAPASTPAASPTFQMPAPIVKVTPEQAALNRADRIALHREKKKSRTYEKTIRYASRKAYAEVRPRIKGRFATKEEVMAYKTAQAQGQVMSIEEWAAIMPTC